MKRVDAGVVSHFMYNINFFTIFDIPESVIIDKNSLRLKFQDLQKQYHPDLNPENIDKSVYLNEAYRTLSSDIKRVNYLLKIKGIDVNTEESKIKPSLDVLEYILEVREKISNFDNIDDLQNIQSDIQNQFNDLLNKIDLLISQDIEKAAEIAITMQYLDKILLEIKNEIIRYI